MIRDRVLAGQDRAKASGKRLGTPRTTSFMVQRIRAALHQRHGVRATARMLKVSAAKVSEFVPQVRSISGNVPDGECQIRAAISVGRKHL
jgi:DNA invertase Pin-like site-specific DNA recombinase